jgi:hypothetical protein
MTAHYFLDSSALVKRYVAETGTTWINSLFTREAGHILYVARISGAELVAALFRRVRTGDLTLLEAQAVATQFKTDFRQRFQVIEITEKLIDSAMILAERYGLRGYDSVQLAAVLELQTIRVSLSLPDITFVCADSQLNITAAVIGLRVEDPNNR